MTSLLLTHDGVLLARLQVPDGHKVALQGRHLLAVLTGDDARLAVQGHLVIVLQSGVLLIGHLQSALGDVVHLQKKIRVGG